MLTAFQIHQATNAISTHGTSARNTSSTSSITAAETAVRLVSAFASSVMNCQRGRRGIGVWLVPQQSSNADTREGWIPARTGGEAKRLPERFRSQSLRKLRSRVEVDRACAEGLLLRTGTSRTSSEIMGSHPSGHGSRSRSATSPDSSQTVSWRLSTRN